MRRQFCGFTGIARYDDARTHVRTAKTMTINLKPELETKLRMEAARRGVDVDVFIARALQGAVEDGHGQSHSVSLPKAEADLLQKINAGPAEETWERYKSLVRRRRDETLTSEQHRELIELSDQIEEDHARRIGNLARLAQLRGVSLESLMAELGIGPRSLGLDD